jgi:hypothetical protein
LREREVKLVNFAKTSKSEGDINVQIAGCKDDNLLLFNDREVKFVSNTNVDGNYSKLLTDHVIRQYEKR